MWFLFQDVMGFFGVFLQGVDLDWFEELWVDFDKIVVVQVEVFEDLFEEVLN